MKTAQPTPGYNSRLRIWIDVDKRGKLRAYRWGAPHSFRMFPMPLDEAEMHLANETATRLSCHPLRGPRG